MWLNRGLGSVEILAGEGAAATSSVAQAGCAGTRPPLDRPIAPIRGAADEPVRETLRVAASCWVICQAAAQVGVACSAPSLIVRAYSVVSRREHVLPLSAR